MTREQLLDDWLAKARHVRRLPADVPWPAWSKGELLAVVLILRDSDMLTELEYTEFQALDRLRWDIGEPSVESARAVFDRLRADIDAGGTS